MAIDIYNTDKLPSGMEIKDLFPMIHSTSMIEISKKNLFKRIRDRNRDEFQEGIEIFKSLAPVEANAIINVQISSTSQRFDNGTFLYIIYLGTPAIIGIQEKQ